jgi:hypothetical protein
MRDDRVECDRGLQHEQRTHRNGSRGLEIRPGGYRRRQQRQEHDRYGELRGVHAGMDPPLERRGPRRHLRHLLGVVQREND